MHVPIIFDSDAFCSRRMRINALHARDSIREQVPFLRCLHFKSFALGAAAAIILPRVGSRLSSACASYRVRQLLNRPHRQAGGCVDSTRVLPKHGFCIGWSDVHRSPLWASYFTCSRAIGGGGGYSNSPQQRQSSSTTKSQARRSRKLQSRFDLRIDPEVPPAYSSSAELAASNNNGFERGHLVAARSLIYSDDAAYDASMHTNIVAQHKSVNRGAYLRAERLIRLWTHCLSPASPLAVCCGPLYSGGSSSSSSSSSRAPIPSAFFVAVLHCRTGKTCAFVIPNNRSGGNAALSSCMMTTNQLERKYSLRIFRDLGIFYRPLPWQRRRLDVPFWRCEPAAVALSTATPLAVASGKTKQKKTRKKKNRSSSKAKILALQVRDFLFRRRAVPLSAKQKQSLLRVSVLLDSKSDF